LCIYVDCNYVLECLVKHEDHQFMVILTPKKLSYVFNLVILVHVFVWAVPDNELCPIFEKKA